MAAHAHGPSRTGLIDPSRPGEYPILLGEKLAGQDLSRENKFIGIRYNHKPKNDSARYKNHIRTVPAAQDRFSLTLEDTVTSGSQNSITYKYRGSVDPKSLVKNVQSGTLALVFDPNRKAFILEPISSELNFNLISSPGQTDTQLRQKYEQLDILEQEHTSTNGSKHRDNKVDASEDDFSAPDDDNPYDYRHFFQQDKADHAATPRAGFEASPSPNLQPTALSTKVLNQPPPTVKAKPKPQPKAKAASASTRTATHKPRAKPKPKSSDKIIENSDKDSSADERPVPRRRSTQSKVAPTIQIDDDLVIDMGSPPPTSRKRKINLQHFASSSNNTSANEADDDELEDARSEVDDDVEHLRLPSPAPHVKVTPSIPADDEDDDGLAAEMEAALEESANEEEALAQQQVKQAVDDESEVSEEE